MKKLILAVAGALAAGTAVTALGMGSSSADTSNSIYNVLGEPYAKAVAILHAEGMSTVFGGSVRGDVLQARCIVQSQKAITSAKMQLMLNCTDEAQPERPAATSAASAPRRAVNRALLPAEVLLPAVEPVRLRAPRSCLGGTGSGWLTPGWLTPGWLTPGWLTGNHPV